MKPPQRKPPAKRLFTGVAGSPLSGSTPAKEPPIPAPDPPKPKAGRPPKGDRPMTATERKRQQRERELREREGPEREELVKKIEKRIKTSEHANINLMRAALGKFRDALDQKSIDDLRAIARSYHIHDRKGRSSLEGHTGGKDLEGIDAAVQRDTKYGGRKPKMGPSPNVDHEFPTMPPLEPPTSSSVAHEEKPKGIRWNDDTLTVWDCLPEITESMFEGDEKEFAAEYDPDEKPELTLRCRANGCSFRAATWFDARKHVEEMIKKGEAQKKFVDQLEEIVNSGTAGYDVALAEARCLYRDKFYPHHAWAASVFRDIRDADQKSGNDLKSQ